jgi:two-component system sensor histidine kinase MprB
MKLQSRLALTVAAAAAIAIFVMGSAFWVLSARQQRESIDDSLLAAVQQPRQLLRESEPGAGRPGRGLEGVFGNASAADDRVFTRVRVTSALGEVVIDQGLPEVDIPINPVITTVKIDGDRFRMASARFGVQDRVGVVQIARNVEDIEDGLGRLRRQILFGGVLGVGLAAMLGALVASRLTAPILEVSAAAKAMASRQDIPSRITVERTDEVGDLANSFNQMLSALEVSRDQQRRLVADASHELRTPLTSLRLKIDLLDRTPGLADEQRQELLAGAASELERLTDLVAELVDLASDPTMTDEQPEAQRLVDVVEETVEVRRRSSGRVITVDVVGESQTHEIRARMVGRAVSNLLDNAIKYSPAEEDVRVVVDGSRIEVHDRGEGIPDADLPHVFDRFFRSPEARTRPGNGIGLAIVQRVADLHGGETWARNADPSGETHRGAVVGFSVSTGK